MHQLKSATFTASELATALEELRFFQNQDRVTSAGLWSNGAEMRQWLDRRHGRGREFTTDHDAE